MDRSPPAPPPPRAGHYLARGIDAYHRLEYETALAQLDAGLAEAARTGALGLAPSELSDLLLYRALVRTEQGDAARAWDDMVGAAVIDPTRRLDPARFPPRAADAFARAVAAVTAGEPIALRVQVPSGCDVAVDARSVAPGVDVEVFAGEHYVRAACPGAIPFGAVVSVARSPHVVTPAIVPIAPPDARDVAAWVRRRGGESFIYAVASRSVDLPATVALRLVDATTARERGAVIVAAAGDVGAAAQRLIDRVVRPPAPIVKVVPPPPAPWYRRPWVWGIAGAAVATAVLVPLLSDTGPSDRFDVAPEVRP
ncbi:MAG: hypothetical protein D6689_03935 [Deltaproteobacteria bacterium]|nr:MAG: hypothetical protein D6689_03935 [Deltaproteobacteria bacterium]